MRHKRCRPYGQSPSKPEQLTARAVPNWNKRWASCPGATSTCVDPTGGWVADAAYQVAAHRENPPSPMLLRRAELSLYCNGPYELSRLRGRGAVRSVRRGEQCCDHRSRPAPSQIALCAHVEGLRFGGPGEGSGRSGLRRTCKGGIGCRVSQGWTRNVVAVGLFPLCQLRAAAARIPRRGKADCAGLHRSVQGGPDCGRWPVRGEPTAAASGGGGDGGEYEAALLSLQERRKQPRGTGILSDHPLTEGRALLGLGRVAEALPVLQFAYGAWLASPDPRGHYAAEAEYWLALAYSREPRDSRPLDACRSTEDARDFTDATSSRPRRAASSCRGRFDTKACDDDDSARKRRLLNSRSGK